MQTVHHRALGRFAACCLGVLSALGLGASLVFTVAVANPSTAVPAETVPSPFEFEEVMVPMRDGVHLQTVILRPRGVTTPLPILLRRTPYGVPEKAPAKVPASLAALAADGYVFVVQNLRGRFKSEGAFSLAADATVDADNSTIETRDAYDTIEWLIHHVPNNNGRVGMMGVSYDGLTTTAALLGPHPALKAASEQASPVDQWLNDDMHRYGALRLSYAFEYSVMEESDKNANTNFAFDQWDLYSWYLRVGPVANVNARYLHDKVPYWNEMTAHPDRDRFWRSQSWLDALHASRVPNLNVAGFWDQEDPWGPWQIFRRTSTADGDRTAVIAAGPWCHGCWEDTAESLGPWQLGSDTAKEYRDTIEAPFFAYWLHDKGVRPIWRARLFETGSNRWVSYPEWPPKHAVATRLYLRGDGSLTFEAPPAGDAHPSRRYVSDPANPVPYRQRPISPTYPGGDWPSWESDDQRFVDQRPDVLTFTSAPLERDLRVAGEVQAMLYAATSGSDSDFVVKLIDQFPETAFQTDWYTNAESEGPKPGAYAAMMNGYQLPIAMEVRRGRYLRSEEHPTALIPNRTYQWEVPLRDRDHVFLKGHRIVVQVQSTWFPLIDRNPQHFVPSIYAAGASDFVKATQTVQTSARWPSHVLLPVLAADP